MFKLIGSGYRWYNKLLLWKALLILFGVLCLFCMSWTQTEQRWQKGDSLDQLPKTCFIGIDDKPWFIPFQDYQGQALKQVADDQIFNATGSDEQWKLYRYNGEWVMRYHRNMFNQSSVYYTVEDDRPVLSLCHAGESFWVSVIKGIALATFIVFALRFLWRKFRHRDTMPRDSGKAKKQKKPKRQQAKKQTQKQAKKQAKKKNKRLNDTPEPVISTTKPQQNSVIDRK